MFVFLRPSAIIFRSTQIQILQLFLATLICLFWLRFMFAFLFVDFRFVSFTLTLFIYARNCLYIAAA